MSDPLNFLLKFSLRNDIIANRVLDTRQGRAVIGHLFQHLCVAGVIVRVDEVVGINRIIDNLGDANALRVVAVLRNRRGLSNAAGVGRGRNLISTCQRARTN